jgi:hypothetical protein
MSTISGGYCNTTSAIYTTISGGYYNTVSGIYSVVSGGLGNSASGYANSINGGTFNVTNQDYSTVAGGGNNTATLFSTVSGGGSNTASCYSTIGGGVGNEALSLNSTIAGGDTNKTSGCRSFVGGGRLNTTLCSYSSILGGSGNTVNHILSSAVGKDVKSVSACTLHVNYLALQDTPILDQSLTDYLVRDSATGVVKYKTAQPSYINTTSVSVSGYTASTNFTYYGVTYSGDTDIQIPSPLSLDGFNFKIKDERGTAGSYRIRVTPTTGLIDGNTYIDMNINYMSLTFVARNNNWWII